MLSELKLSNFRMFDDEVTVRFRPITVLIGRNSSGKSSIIKFVLMLNQSMLSESSQFPVVGGGIVKMGNFKELKNTETNKDSLGFELSFCAPFSSYRDSISRVLLKYEELDKSGLLSVRGKVPYSDKPAEGTIAYSLGQIDPVVTHVEFVTSFAEDYTFSVNAKISAMNKAEETLLQIEKLSKPDRAQVKSLLPLVDAFFEKVDASTVLESELSSAYHLPPVMVELDRVVDSSHMSRDSVGSEGRLAVAHLERIKTEDVETYKFLLPHLRNVAGIESVEFKTTPEDITRALAKNRETGADVLIADYGFGVSQCLPVLVQGALMSPHRSLMVEQPEAQLHPTAQLELGSFFADLWTQRNVGSVIETHSSNILLRLRRLIANGNLSHEDVSVAYFTLDEERGNVPIVKNLDIDEDGSMQPGLPMEFFGADIREGLQLGARK